MKKYTFKVVVDEGNDEYWEKLLDEKVSGCDEITAYVTDAIANGDSTAGMDVTVKLIKFEDV